MAQMTSGEINYFYQDEHGKVLKLRKPIDHKPESGANNRNNNGNAGVDISSKIGAFSPMDSANHQGQYMRVHNNYNMPIKAGILTPQSSVSDFSDVDVIKTERFGKYAQNTNNMNKMKTKLHSIQSNTTPTSAVQKRRKLDKSGKGLRHFSMKVCGKVKEKGKTTYNEVADELVNEELQNNLYESNCDQKNIRRRVYDALNVLMAMSIISKDKKEIRWIGFPTNSVDQCTALEKENAERRERIKQKHQQLRELVMQQVALKSLIERNRHAERQGVVPTSNSAIELPFIIVNTYKTTKINCSVTNDKSEYIFKFDDEFEMHDDLEVLKRMGFYFGLDKGECTPDEIEHAKSLVPPNFAKYIEAYAKGDSICANDIEPNKTYLKRNNTNESQFNSTSGNNILDNIKNDISLDDVDVDDDEDDDDYSDND